MLACGSGVAVTICKLSAAGSSTLGPDRTYSNP